MGALVGFIFGYMLGVKAGPQGYEEMRKAWQEISNSPEFKGLVATGTAFVENLLSQGSAGVAGQLEAMTGKDGDLQQMWQKLSGTGDLLGAWSSISKSDEFQALVSNGMSLIGGVIGQGAAVLSQRLKDGQVDQPRM